MRLFVGFATSLTSSFFFSDLTSLWAWLRGMPQSSLMSFVPLAPLRGQSAAEVRDAVELREGRGADEHVVHLLEW